MIHVAQPGAVINLGELAKYRVRPTRVAERLNRVAYFFETIDSMVIKLRPDFRCAPVDLGFTSLGDGKVKVSYLIALAANGLDFVRAQQGTGLCGCGSQRPFVQCCRRVTTRSCKTKGCVNPMHLRVHPRRADVEQEARALRRVREMDSFTNRLTQSDLRELAKLHPFKNTFKIMRSTEYLAQRFHEKVPRNVARDIVFFAHSTLRVQNHEANVEEEDASEGVRLRDRRNVNSIAASASKNMLYEHAEQVARRLRVGVKVNIEKYASDASGVVFISGGALRAAVKKLMDDPEYYNKNKPRFDMNDRARSLAIKFDTQPTSVVWEMIKDDALAKGLSKRNLMNVIRRAQKRCRLLKNGPQ